MHVWFASILVNCLRLEPWYARSDVLIIFSFDYYGVRTLGSSTAVVFMSADGLRTSEIGASRDNFGGDIAYQRGMQL